MPRSIWTGAISFGLVTVPVKLYSAVQRKTVRFHQLNAKTGVRIQQRRVDPTTGDEVHYEDLVKGYELTPDRYVVVEPGELEALDPKKTKTIDIEDFVDLEEIDPIYYDHPYYLAPAQGGAKPYRLLVEAMRDAGKVAVARVVIRSKQQLVAIRPLGEVLAMATMVFSDEVVDASRLDEVPAADDIETTQREVAMARQLIDSLAGPFEPDKYRDTYRDEVLELIERKAQGEEIAVQPVADEPEPVPDLMAALKASLDQVRSREGAEGNGGSAGKTPASRAKSGSSSGGSAKKGGGKGSAGAKGSSGAKSSSGGKGSPGAKSSGGKGSSRAKSSSGAKGSPAAKSSSGGAKKAPSRSKTAS
ncbi:MAG: Ku protein [Actinomycetota bacterium]|jgi:DNA end-binding protein Ku|nr:Ku protein [Actinomycetota bacterium]MDQ3408664.1 Ku protein [Actinomycetota bacterium]